MSTREIGTLGERFAAEYLEGKGYTILARNYYSSHCEIDLIARIDRYLCFVEVKTRRITEAARYGRPAAAVGYTKQKRLIYAVEQYLRRNPGTGQPRLDVIEVYLPDHPPLPDRPAKIVHMPGAFFRK